VKTLPSKSLSPWSYLATLCAVHLVFFIFYLISIFEISFDKMWIVQLASLLLIFLSAAILFVKNRGEAAAQTFRLLIISVVQLLGYLSICLALIYSDQDAVLVLYVLGLSLSILILQTSYFVRRLK
jgi:hypothetical protein